jgi:2-oxo-3-hexenedioate decarboxylase
MTQVASPPATSSADEMANHVLAALADRRQIEPLTARAEGLELGQAYRVTAAVRKAREARGERVVGRRR